MEAITCRDAEQGQIILFSLNLQASFFDKIFSLRDHDYEMYRRTNTLRVTILCGIILAQFLTKNGF